VVEVEVKNIPAQPIEADRLIGIATAACPKAMAHQVTSSLRLEFRKVSQLSKCTIHWDRVGGVATELTRPSWEAVESTTCSHPPEH
jgi:hypothetical protein